MNNNRLLAALALATLLSACSQGGGTPAVTAQGGAQNAAASEKQLYLQQEQAAAAKAWAAPKHPGFLPDTIPSDKRELGISSMGLPGGSNDFVNRYDLVDAAGNYETVLAGVRKADGQGVVTVILRSRDLHEATVRSFVVGPGKVRIAGVNPDGSLQLQSLSGERTQFRVPL